MLLASLWSSYVVISRAETGQWSLCLGPARLDRSHPICFDSINSIRLDSIILVPPRSLSDLFPAFPCLISPRPNPVDVSQFSQSLCAMPTGYPLYSDHKMM